MPSGVAWGGRCGQCRNGVAPGDCKRFDPWCPGCQTKLKAGLRTGLEPMPAQGPQRGGWVDLAKAKRQKQAAQAARAAQAQTGRRAGNNSR